MGIGREDYSIAVVPIQAIFGKGQTPIYIYEHVEIDSLTTKDIISYTVESGYKFHITSFMVSLELPGVNVLQLIESGGNELYTSFDTAYQCNFPPGAIFDIIGWNIVKLRATNLDSIKTYFRGYIVGFLEQIS